MKNTEVIMRKRKSSVVLFRKRSKINTKIMIRAILCAIMILYAFSLQMRIREQSVDIAEQKAKTEEANAQYKEQQQVTNQYVSELKDAQEYNAQLEGVIASSDDREKSLLKTVKSLDKELKKTTKAYKELSKQYDDVESNYNTLKNRKELYDKYSYAIIDSAGKRTDLSYDDIQYGEDLMKKYGYNPHILFGIFGVESGYKEDAANKKSTARGYGQLLAGTAKYVYEDILDKGTYTHSYALNGKTNIELTTAYLNYLMDKNHNDLFKSISNYCGRDTSGTHNYLKCINKAYQKEQDIYKIINGR